MTEPVTFMLKPEGGTWTLLRDGRHVADYSHVDQATHDAVRLARELDASGAPAKVLVQAAEDRIIEIEVDPDVTQEDARELDRD